jgi:hypothetical protein
MGIADSQERVTSALIRQDSSSAPRSLDDTLIFQAGSNYQVISPHAKSGSLAMLLSAILPGAGQVYAHRYYTIPIIWGCAIYFYSQWNYCNNIYKEFQGLYADSVKSTTANPKLVNYYRDTRDSFHNHRDGFAVYIALTYILNIIDAYVAATLYSFDVSDNLGGSTEIRFRIPLH